MKIKYLILTILLAGFALCPKGCSRKETRSTTLALSGPKELIGSKEAIKKKMSSQLNQIWNLKVRV